MLNPPPAELAPPTLRHAYATQAARMMRLGETTPAAFKLGGTNEHTRTVFSVDAPYFGMLSSNEIVYEPHLSWDDRVAPRAEPEIAVAVNECLTPRPEGYSLLDLSDAIAWVAPALDISDTALADPLAAGLSWMVADTCEAGRLVVGERWGADALQSFEDSLVALIIDGHIVSYGCGQALIGGALGALREFLMVLAALDVDLPAGVPVALGGCAPSKPLPLRGQVEARFGDAGSVKIAV